jgi:geranylgeranyl pyrophosphate synthase
MTVPDERLCHFVHAVRETTLSLIDDDRLAEDQQDLLRRCVSRFFDLSDPNDWAQPLGLLYATYRGLGAPTTRKAHLVGAFLVCYFTAGDAFDDIQDADLAGKVLGETSVPIAINTALALFLVGLRALNEGSRLEADPTRRAGYFDVLNRASLIAIGAQHMDLAGLGQAATPEAVLVMNRGKVACVSLVAECGALLGEANPTQAATFRDFGTDFAALVQIVDDVRDVFGKAESPDLVAGKTTYPIACFQADASPDELAEFSRLRTGLPETIEPIRELLCSSGALDASASAAEDLRRSMYQRLVALGALSAEHRLLLSIVDALASTLYQPESVAEWAHQLTPTGPFHDEVRSVATRFMGHLGQAAGLSLPELKPWHAPLYLFEPGTQVIRYPDLEDLRREVIGLLGELLPLDSAGADDAMEAGMPLLLAHELFHAWRHALGRLSADAWHEEFVANRLAMGYALRFEPEAAQATIAMSQVILDVTSEEPGEGVLLERARAQGDAADYDLSFRGAARVHARMLLDAARECDFDADRTLWLGPLARGASESAEDFLAAE